MSPSIRARQPGSPLSNRARTSRATWLAVAGALGLSGWRATEGVVNNRTTGRLRTIRFERETIGVSPHQKRLAAFANLPLQERDRVTGRAAGAGAVSERGRWKAGRTVRYTR